MTEILGRRQMLLLARQRDVLRQQGSHLLQVEVLESWEACAQVFDQVGLLLDGVVLQSNLRQGRQAGQVLNGGQFVV